MSEMDELHRRAGEILKDVVRRIPQGRWADPTPCEEWDLRDLLHHIAWSNLWVRPLVRGESLAEVAPRLEGDVLAEDPVGVTVASVDESSDAFAEPGALDRPVELSRGTAPAREYCAERMNDLTVHAWDVAAATGLDVRLDPGCMEAAMAFYRPLEAKGRPAGMFGPPVEVSAEADLQTRFLAFWGRRTDWEPPG